MSKSIRRLLLLVLIVLAAFLLLMPTKVQPVNWRPPEAPSMKDGLYAENQRLKDVQRVGAQDIDGPEALLVVPKPIERKAFVLGLDVNAQVIANLQDGSADNYSPITTALEYGDWLYLGSLTNDSMARLPLKQALAR